MTPGARFRQALKDEKPLQIPGAINAYHATLAKANGVQPCIGLYRQAVRPLLAERIGQGRRSLYDLVPADRLLLVSIDVTEATNVNTPDALEQ